MLLNATQRQAVLMGFPVNAPFDGDDVLVLSTMAMQRVTFEDNDRPNALIIMNGLIDFICTAEDEWFGLVSVSTLTRTGLPYHMLKHRAFMSYAHQFRHLIDPMNSDVSMWKSKTLQYFPMVSDSEGTYLPRADFQNAVAMHVSRLML